VRPSWVLVGHETWACLAAPLVGVASCLVGLEGAACPEGLNLALVAELPCLVAQEEVPCLDQQVWDLPERMLRVHQVGLAEEAWACQAYQVVLGLVLQVAFQDLAVQEILLV